MPSSKLAIKHQSAFKNLGYPAPSRYISVKYDVAWLKLLEYVDILAKLDFSLPSMYTSH